MRERLFILSGVADDMIAPAPLRARADQFDATSTPNAVTCVNRV